MPHTDVLPAPSCAERMAALGIVVLPDTLEKHPAWSVPIGVDGGVGENFVEVNARTLLAKSSLRTNGTEDFAVLAQAILLALEKDGLAPASTFESGALMVRRRLAQCALPLSERTFRDVIVISEEVRCGGVIWYPLFLDRCRSSIALTLMPGVAVLSSYWGTGTSVFATPR